MELPAATAHIMELQPALFSEECMVKTVLPSPYVQTNLLKNPVA
jgi:hypothetical protein